jgi:hypothetical protein
MKYRFVFFSALVISALVAAFCPTSAQEVSVSAMPGTVDLYQDTLAFSRDGRFLREIASIRSFDTDKFSHVRVNTYVAATGEIRHTWDLQPDTWCFSTTTDGRIAVISADRDRQEGHTHLFLFDTETGRPQDIPSSWYDGDLNNPYAAISGDGRLVSAFSDSGAEDGPLVVTLYNWRTKKVVAKHSEGYPAGGISWGGVTEDGKITFLNNRVGGDVVEPKTGRLLVTVGTNSHRSPDGAWDVEFPNTMYSDAPLEVIIANRRGEVVGKLDIQMTIDNQQNWSGARAAFCGTSGRFIAATNVTVQAFEIPSGRQIASFPAESWRTTNPENAGVTSVACSLTGRRVAIRSGERLTLHDLN